MFFYKLLGILLLLITPFIVMIISFYIYYYSKGKRRIKGEYKPLGHGSLFKRLLWEFPKRFVLDLFNRNPDYFREYGVHMVCGEQGKGKTVTVTYLLHWYKKMYPKLKIKTNYNYLRQDGEINHWKDLINSNNGKYGEIDVIDEIQNWFNSLQSKDFPPEMMGEITQQRKQSKIILGTSQVFTRMAKPIREQTTFLYEPFTLFHCITIVPKYKPCLDETGTMTRKRLLKVFFFIQTEEIRESFDTYKKIQTLATDGFKTETEQIHNVVIDTKFLSSMNSNKKVKK